MAWSGDQAEGRGPGPPLGAPMAILPYGYPGSHQISDMVAFPSHGPQGRNQGAAVDYMHMAFDKLPATYSTDSVGSASHGRYSAPRGHHVKAVISIDSSSTRSH